MTWDYATGDEYVAIEAVKDGEVIGLIAEIPLTCANAEQIAETICNAHNFGTAAAR